MKNLVLYVEMTDVTPLIHWGGTPDSRVVRVELTPEQCDLLETRVAGRNAGNDYHERRRPVSIQEEEAAPCPPA
jgi:hypothetical protein